MFKKSRGGYLVSYINFRDDLYNRKPYLNHLLPDFWVHLTTSYLFDFDAFEKKYTDSKPYIKFFKLLKSRQFSQLLSDHRLDKYCMYNMIDNGKLDDFGSLIPSQMKKNRPKVD